VLAYFGRLPFHEETNCVTQALPYERSAELSRMHDLDSTGCHDRWIQKREGPARGTRELLSLMVLSQRAPVDGDPSSALRMKPSPCSSTRAFFGDERYVSC